MSYTAIDIAQSLLSLLLYVPLLVLPGLALAWLTRRDGDTGTGISAATGIVLATAILPWLDSMTVRAAGLGFALTINLALALGGLAVVLKRPPRFDPAALAAGAAWTGLVLLLTADVDWDGKLFQSAVVIDMVKHGATIRSIVETGAPPADPFFARDTPSGYYYFFYTVPALAVRLGAGLVEPRAAFAGGVVWTGIAVLGLAAATIRAAGIAERAKARAINIVLLALLLTTGLDLAPVAFIGLLSGNWMQTLEWWNEQVTSWVGSAVWVPHHVAAFIASWLALMWLAEESARFESRARPASVRRLVFAALALTSAFGMSVWVALTAACSACLWCGLLAARRRWRALLPAVLVGLGALAAAAPTIADMLANRSYGGLPVVPTIRAFHIWSALASPGILDLIGRIVLLPVNYGIEFGIFLLGTVAFWTAFRAERRQADDVAVMLAIGAVAGLLLATFARSAIIGNDLGWRAMLFPQFAALLWTASAVLTGKLPLILRGPAAAEGRHLAGSRLRLRPTLAGILLLIGYCGIAYDAVALRTMRGKAFEASEPHVARELRETYSALNRELPGEAVLQHNPAPTRVYDFGMYSRHRVAVADREAELFGASRAAVFERLRQLGPIFATPLSTAAVRAAALRNGVGYLVVTSLDPVWRDANSWLWSTKPVRATEHVRVIATADLAPAAVSEGLYSLRTSFQ